MRLSQITRLTLCWLDSVDDAMAHAAVGELVEHLQAAGNTRDQVEHWLSYAGEMSAVEGETLAAVEETEAIMARMQGRIL